MKRVLGTILLVGACSTAWGAGSYFGGQWGVPDNVAVIGLSGASNHTMSTLNNGYSARFMARSAADITSVRMRWTTVTTPGTVDIRIETDDGAGKPSGTLYDANAVLSGQTPSTAGGAAGQLFTFAVAPTTGLTTGNYYHVVIITSATGTTHQLTAYAVRTRPQMLPVSVLTAADASIRTNFAEVASSIPIIVLGLEDGSTESFGVGFMPYATVTGNVIHGTNGVALKLKTVTQLSVVGVSLAGLEKTGTPAGDLRVRIFDLANNPISGASVTVDKDMLLTNLGVNGATALFPGTVTLPAGSYRIVLDCASCANSSNCWNIDSPVALAASASSPEFVLSTSADLVTWTDTTGSVVSLSLITENAAGSGGSYVIGG